MTEASVVEVVVTGASVVVRASVTGAVVDGAVVAGASVVEDEDVVMIEAVAGTTVATVSSPVAFDPLAVIGTR